MSLSDRGISQRPHEPSSHKARAGPVGRAGPKHGGSGHGTAVARRTRAWPRGLGTGVRTESAERVYGHGGGGSESRLEGRGRPRLRKRTAGSTRGRCGATVRGHEEPVSSTPSKRAHCCGFCESRTRQKHADTSASPGQSWTLSLYDRFPAWPRHSVASGSACHSVSSHTARAAHVQVLSWGLGAQGHSHGLEVTPRD